MIKVNVHVLMSVKEVIGASKIALQIHDSATLKELVDLLVDNYGEKFSDLVINPDTGEPYKYFRLVLNGRDIIFLNGMKTTLSDGDEFLIIPPIGGG
ncbi:ThiS family protein [Pelotomaculum schinkii]|uniref:ThiS family protein n=1 Tax=Pelotomaculum schinkii TaxID=78350 RepID=A0A4Y7R6H2_9FIRM|nr:MoaD/ThiS family protein [Pelotomaculum schinkii]TEB04447.1 ThiS family protein [Pelotomaculum schinkii]